MEYHDKDAFITQLRESEDRYRSITETSIDAIITADTNDRILTWNKGAEGIFGHGKEILGESVTTIIPERYRKAHRDGVKRFLETGEMRLTGKTKELEAIKKDGYEFPIELSLSSWESPSGIYFGAIIRDISERRHIERLREDVQRMMRHDLKSPLLGITGLARVLQKGDNLTDRQRKTAALILELGKKTLKFIDRSQDLFQIEQGTFKLRPKPINLIGVLNRIKKELEPLTFKKRAKIKTILSDQRIEKEAEYILYGEEDLIEIMLANLIKNAVEATPERGTVRIHITVDEKGDQGSHIIDIHNMGIVPEDMRGRFFEPYATSGKRGGAGLGTYSALLIARTHKGEISFASSEGEGTHVIIRLPKTMK